MGDFGKPAKVATPNLIALLNDSNGQVRTQAAWALGEIGESTIVTPHLIALLNEPNWVLSSTAAAALTKLGQTDKGVAHLIALLKVPQARNSTIVTLGSLGTSAKRAIPSLIPLLNDPDGTTRHLATETLKKLGYQP